jgi:SNF2 family DNA or RNA helicase
MHSIELLKEKVEAHTKRIKENQYKGNLEEEKFKLKPRSYQLDGIKYGLEHGNFLLADEQGTGKSLQLTNIARLDKGGQHCLIIVGYDALQFNWANEIEKYCDEKAYVIGQRVLKAGKNKGDIRKGNTKERIEDFLNLKNNDAFFIITSVTTIRTTEKTKYIDKNGKEKTSYKFTVANIIEDLCKQGIIGRVIFDEGQVVKSIDAIQTKALLRIKSANYKVIATGTPIMNKHIDLYPLMSWLGYTNENYFEFRNKYCVMGGFKNKQIVGNKNGDELNKRLEQFMLRRKKEDVLDLPEKIIIDEVLEMDYKQAVLYDKIQKIAKSTLVKMKGNKAALLAMLIKLRQITCHPKWIDNKFEDSVKFERVHQLMHEITDNNRKAIIFSNWATPIEWLYDELQIYNPAMITGSTKDRMSEVKKFQEDDSCKVIVGTGGAMGTGLTLTAASNVIFIDEPWNRALKDQWTDRAHRIGTKNNVNIYTLICKGTVDEMVHRTVLTKGMVSDNVVDGISLEELEKYIESL